MNQQKNQQVWEQHYQKDKSMLLHPDENVIRYFFKNQDFFNNRPNFSLLDLGCGSGRHAVFFEQNRMNRISALDYSQIAQERNQKTFSNLAISWQVGDVTQLPYHDREFDFILSWGVFHYLDDHGQKKMISEIKRCLKPNGRLLMTVRASDDRHLEPTMQAGDLAGGSARLFSREELGVFFADCQKLQFGFISRIPLGETNLISHHIIEAIW